MHKRLPIKLMFFSAILALSSSLALGILSYRMFYESFNNYFMQSKIAFAKVLANRIDGDIHSTFTSPSVMATEEYKLYLNFLSTTLSYDPSITYIYTVLPKEGGFTYALDAKIVQKDTIWVESEDFAFVCFYDEKGLFTIENKQTNYQKDFTIAYKDSYFTVKLKTEDGMDALLLDDTLLFSIASKEPLTAIVNAENKALELLSKDNNNLPVPVFIKDEKLHLTFSFTAKGEAESFPGSIYINNESNIQKLQDTLISKKENHDTEIQEDNYGPLLSFRVPIVKADKSISGLLIIDISMREFNKISKQILVAIIVAYTPVFILLLLGFYLIINLLVLKPLKTLMHGVSLLRLGEDLVLLDIRSHDEFESFADSFNAMAFTIHESRLKLEETVKERTIELHAAYEELKEKSEKLDEIAHHDPMTGLANRLEVMRSLTAERERLHRYADKTHSSSSLIFIDLDNFKYYNDKFGHPVGDLILKEFASLLKNQARNCDITGRFGGDEFIVMLPETSVEGARFYMERIAERIEQKEWFKKEIEAYKRK